MDGILRIRNHIIGGRFNGEIAGAYAGRVLYLTSAMLTGQAAVIKIKDPSVYSNEKTELPSPRSYSYQRTVDPVSYGYAVEAGRLLKTAGILNL